MRSAPRSASGSRPAPRCSESRRGYGGTIAAMTAPDPRTQPRAFLEHLYRAAVHRALPLHNTAAFLPKPPRGRTIVLGAGKAGGAMAQAVEALWPANAP